MSRFFDTGGHGWVNLDLIHEARLIARDEKTGAETWRLYDGKTTYTTERPFDPDHLLATIIPAAKDAFVYVPWVGNETEDHTARPTEVGVYMVPVIAWTITLKRPDFSIVTPITTDDWGSNMEGSGNPMPDGKVCVPYDRVYENVDDYKAAYLAEQQEKWDKTHKTKDEAA